MTELEVFKDGFICGAISTLFLSIFGGFMFAVIDSLKIK